MNKMHTEYFRVCIAEFLACNLDKKCVSYAHYIVYYLEVGKFFRWKSTLNRKNSTGSGVKKNYENLMFIKIFCWAFIFWCLVLTLVPVSMQNYFFPSYCCIVCHKDTQIRYKSLAKRLNLKRKLIFVIL